MVFINGVHCISVSTYWDSSTILLPLPYLEVDTRNNACYNVIDRSVMEDSLYMSMRKHMSSGSVLPEMVERTWSEVEVHGFMIPIKSDQDIIKQCAPADQSTSALIIGSNYALGHQDACRDLNNGENQSLYQNNDDNEIRNPNIDLSNCSPNVDLSNGKMHADEVYVHRLNLASDKVPFEHHALSYNFKVLGHDEDEMTDSSLIFALSLAEYYQFKCRDDNSREFRRFKASNTKILRNRDRFCAEYELPLTINCISSVMNAFNRVEKTVILCDYENDMILSNIRHVSLGFRDSITVVKTTTAGKSVWLVGTKTLNRKLLCKLRENL